MAVMTHDQNAFGDKGLVHSVLKYHYWYSVVRGAKANTDSRIVVDSALTVIVNLVPCSQPSQVTQRDIECGIKCQVSSILPLLV